MFVAACFIHIEQLDEIHHCFPRSPRLPEVSKAAKVSKVAKVSKIAFIGGAH
jgi:hypothetical protein